jgi:hypothetical protein
MLEQNNEIIKTQAPISKEKDETNDENVTVHTMQDDVNSLSGIFPKEENLAIPNANNIDKVQSIQKNPGNNQYFNPFLDKQSSSEAKNVLNPAINDEILKVNNAAVKSKTIPNNPVNQLEERNSSSLKKIIWIAAIIVVCGSFVGGYYFLSSNRQVVENNKSETNTQESNKVANEESKKEETTNIESIPKYLSDKANYLTIDMENPSYDNFKKAVLDVSSEIASSGTKEPVEFIVTNNEHTPVYFSIFKTISGIKLSDNLMKTLGDNFSLFVYHDSGKLRLSLAIDVTDQAKAATLIKTEEAGLFNALSSLIFEEISAPKGKFEFKDNNYKGVNIRYLNLNDKFSSVDYAFSGNKLIFGFSKESMLTTLDRVLNGGK